MTPKRQIQAWTAVGLSLTLAAAANGCEIIANFDRSLIPSEGGVDAAFDANFDAAAPEDAGIDSTVPVDSSTGVDSGHSDSGQDANVADSTATDTGAVDSNVADTNVADTNVADTNAPDTSVEDASDDGG
jgi:hypothetical protein